MDESEDVKIDSDLLDDNKMIVKPFRFTAMQIENLLKLQLLNKSPRDCVLLVSFTLELDDIKENNVHFWMADILTVVVKNIQRMCMSVLQGTIAIDWICHFMSLAVGDDKLSKIELFKTLYECIKDGLANATDEFTIPALTNHTVYSKVYPMSTTSSSNSVKYTNSSNTHMPAVTATLMAQFIFNTIHEIFWDDFKYTVIQTAFNAKSIKMIKIENSIKTTKPYLFRNKNGNEIEDLRNNFKCNILNRYFFRQSNYNTASSSATDQFWSI